MRSVCANEYAIVGNLALTNYAFCLGTGTTTGQTGWLGSPYNADGVYYVQSTTRMADILDGTSNTVGISERPLGVGDESSMVASRAAIDPRTMYVNPQIADDRCELREHAQHQLRATSHVYMAGRRAAVHQLQPLLPTQRPDSPRLRFETTRPAPT